jgi:tryptophan synthase alpha subunit
MAQRNFSPNFMQNNNRADKNSRKFLMAHLVAGFPDKKTALQLAKNLINAGADILEIQIPFSDPIADGVTIVEACHLALKNGSGYKMALQLCNALSKQTKIPLVIMSYANVPYQIGFVKFCKAIKKAGASALIVPDLPFDSEEGQKLFAICVKEKINLIEVVSPGISLQRLQKIISHARGFIYCTTKRGTTGQSGNMSASRKIVKSERAAPKELFAMLAAIKKYSNLPVAVGFGIASAADIKFLKNRADIFVVGSAFIKMFSSSRLSNVSKLKKISFLAKEIKKFLNS